MNDNINQVIFLGAGASAAEGAPLQKDLLREYFISYRKDKNNNNHEMDNELHKFFKIFFNIDIITDNLNSIDFPTFEEVLGILELAIQRNESFLGYSSTAAVPKIQKLRDYIILLIALVLEEKLRISVTNHGVLVDKLKNQNQLLNTTFISLNYDIIIDNQLVILYPDYHLDYGIDFINFSRQDDWKRPENAKTVKLYKLHGSLNWLYCPTCVSVKLTPKEKGVIKLKWKPKQCLCPICKTLTTPIVIPPTFFKVMSNYYLQQIWHKAEHGLNNANKIIFCGYSFPDADIHIKYLLKRVEINNQRTPKIYIINNYKNKSKYEKDEEKSRYLRFFSNKQNINYTELSFQEFCVFNFNDIIQYVQ